MNEDPFIITRCPHIYVLGNQPEFQTDIVEGECNFVPRRDDSFCVKRDVRVRR